MAVISSHTIQTEPRGFARCTWPAVSRAQAQAAARALSEQAKSVPQYPNAFWVLEGERPICKFYRGRHYAPEGTI